MSTQVGTLQPKARMGRTILPVVVLALLVAATFVAIVTSPDREVARVDTTVANTAANTPSETRFGITQSAAANTAANTPSETRFGITQSAAANTAANTPSETRFGITQSATGSTDAAVATRGKQLGVEIGAGSVSTSAGDSDCPICWKYR